MKFFQIDLFFVIVELCCAPPVQQLVFRSSESTMRSDVPRTLLFIPIGTITSQYLDNTTLLPEIELSDSFYCDAANNLLLYECSRVFTVKNVQGTDSSNHIDRWTSFSNDTTGKGCAVLSIRQHTEMAGVEYAMVVYSCGIKHTATQQDGWRQGKYSGAYERPVAYLASAYIHAQLWNKEGVLLFEKRGTGSFGRPIFYNTMKKRGRNKSADVVNYSRKLFSPPLLRALSKAARNAMMLH